MTYSFGAFDLDTDLFELRRAGSPVPIEPQVFGVLAYLVENRDRVVTKNDLLDHVWGDRFVSESALTTRIKAARRAVGDDGQRQQIIKTLHGRGYRFVAAVRVDEARASEIAPTTHAVAEPAWPTRWPMVGRSRELELLARSFRTQEGGGVLLGGTAGVGKTRLAETCLELAEAAGLSNARVTGHHEGRSIPLAAFAHLLPLDVTAAGTDELDRAAVFHRARAALREQAADHRMLLLIDDGDQLDDLSRALVTSLVQTRTVFAVLTMRTGAGSTPFDHLVKDGHLLRLDIEPLSEESVETLLHRVLGGPLVGESLARFAEAAMGNPGVLRQLVETALDAGRLVERDGVWRLSGPLQPTSSLEGLVADRLRGLDGVHHHAAELLAVAGEMSHDALASIAGEGVLEDLEHRGLLTVRTSARRVGVSLAHPLFAEVLLGQLPALRLRRLRRELADAIETVGGRRRDDGVRLVAWRLDGGGAVDGELVLNAARLALLHGDDAIAERLIRRAVDDGSGDARATQLLAELHFRRNDPEQVEAILAAIDLSELSEPERVRAVRRRSGNRFYGLTDADAALAVLDETEHLFTDPVSRRALQAHRATILSMAGRIDEALACSEPLMDAGAPSARFEALRARSLALAAAGRGDEALNLIAEASTLHGEFDHDLTRPGRSILLFNELFALTEIGRLDDARALGDRAAGDDPVGGRISWLAFGRPRVELLVGNAAAALSLSEPYALEVRARGAFGAERWVLSLAGMARLLAGSIEAGVRDLDRVAALWPHDHGLFRSDRDRALGWLAAERDGLPSAQRVLEAGAANARKRGAFALEAMLLHDVVRFGGAPAVVERLVALTGVVQGDLGVARADHVAGVVAADVGKLSAATSCFERLGSPLLAAEASVDLAVVAESQGDLDCANAATERARELVGRLDAPVVTPALSRIL